MKFLLWWHQVCLCIWQFHISITFIQQLDVPFFNHIWRITCFVQFLSSLLVTFSPILVNILGSILPWKHLVLGNKLPLSTESYLILSLIYNLSNMDETSETLHSQQLSVIGMCKVLHHFKETIHEGDLICLISF